MPVSQQEDARQRAGYLTVLVSALHSLQSNQSRPGRFGGASLRLFRG